MTVCINLGGSHISIHAPAKGATSYLGVLASGFMISIHAPAKGATYCCSDKNHERTDFNPRSREGSDFHQRQDQAGHHISIHAPAKGATVRQLFVKWRFCISIHAPAKGATFSVSLFHLLKLISIHAPAKGATVWVM